MWEDRDLNTAIEAWQAMPPMERKQYYAASLGVMLAQRFARLPLAGRGRDMAEFRPRALVSLLGFSWETVALLSAWAQPEQILVLGTGPTLAQQVEGEPVSAVIARVSGVPASRFRFEELQDEDESSVYRAVQTFARDGGFAPGEVAIDPTGGKKGLSAAAALAGFMLSAPILYVDYAEYSTEERRPAPGTEYPRLLTNPLEVFGDIEIKRALEAFDAGHFEEARRRAELVAERHPEPREARVLACLAEGYGNWSRGDLDRACKVLREGLKGLQDVAAEFSWRWAGGLETVVTENVTLLEEILAIGDQPADMATAMPLVLNQVAASRRAADLCAFEAALPLLYSAFEWYINLRIRIDFGLRDDQLFTTLIEDKKEAFHRTGKLLYGEAYQAQMSMGGRLMFGKGLQVLATLAPEEYPEPEELQTLIKMGDIRNNTPFGHIRQFVPVAEETFRSFETAVVGALGRCAGTGRIETQLARFRFPKLSDAR